MRRLAVLILAFIIAVSFSNSMFMYSLEEGEACIEAYNLNHLVQNSNFNVNDSTRENNESVTQNRINRNYNHLHVRLLNILSLDNSSNISFTLTKSVTTLHYSSDSGNSLPAYSSPSLSSHKPISPLILSSPIPQHNRVLLI